MVIYSLVSFLSEIAYNEFQKNGSRPKSAP